MLTSITIEIVVDDGKELYSKKRVLVPKPGTDGTWKDADWYSVELDDSP